MSTIKTGTTLTTAYQVVGDTTGTFVVQTGSTPTTAMTIDTSQNVGIGTSSPAYPLDVVASSVSPAIQMRGRSADDISSLIFNNNTATAGTNISYIQGLASASGYMSFGTLSTERMRIDSSGSLVLKTSDSNTTKFGLKRTTLYNGDLVTGAMHTVAPTIGWSDGGGLAFATMAGNNAGTATLTDRLLIDDVGNVTVNTSTPIGKLTAYNPTGFAVAGIGNQGNAQASLVARATGGASNQVGGVAFFGTFYNYPADTGPRRTADIWSGYASGTWGTEFLAFGVANAGDASNLTTERMRIDGNGSFLVGTTASSFGGSTYRQVNYSPSLYNTAGGLGIVDGGATLGGFFLGFVNSSNATIGSISHNATSTVAYNTSSDYRLKENIAPMTGALETVAQLKPVTYTWKADGSDGEGFIAHELAEVCPRAVTGEKDAVNEDGSIKPQGIDTSFLVATLTAAIQEQQALIETLTQRIAALENK